jgi:hypothetical protein
MTAPVEVFVPCHILIGSSASCEVDMTNKETDAIVRRAELEIGQILKRLELETKRFVEGVDLRNGPIGCLTNEHQECLRHVALTMRHPPGSNWQ